MEIFNIFFQLQVMETIQNHSIFTFFFSIFFIGDILLIEIRLVVWFWPFMNILNPILDKDSMYPGSNVVSCANIPLLHLGSVFFRAKFHQHAFLFKTSLMMLNM
jgi:hypothetical protein